MSLNLSAIAVRERAVTLFFILLKKSERPSTTSTTIAGMKR